MDSEYNEQCHFGYEDSKTRQKKQKMNGHALVACIMYILYYTLYTLSCLTLLYANLQRSNAQCTCIILLIHCANLPFPFCSFCPLLHPSPLHSTLHLHLHLHPSSSYFLSSSSYPSSLSSSSLYLLSPSNSHSTH